MRALVLLLCLTSVATAERFVGVVQIARMLASTRGLGTPPDGATPSIPIYGEVVFNSTPEGGHIAWERVTMLPIEPFIFDRAYEGLKINIDTTVETVTDIPQSSWNLLQFSQLHGFVDYEPTGLEGAELFAASRISQSGMMHRVSKVDYSEFPERIFVDLDGGVYGRAGLRAKNPSGLTDYFSVPDTSLRINSFHFWATLSRGVEYRRTPLGDATNDGVVGFDDFLILQANFGEDHGASWEDGDFDGDNAVTFGDFLKLSDNWSPDGVTSVPEPGGLFLLAIGFAAYRVFLTRGYRFAIAAASSGGGSEGSVGNVQKATLWGLRTTSISKRLE